MAADLERVLAVLVPAQVHFIVIGGWAAALHGSARSTLDVDVVYGRSRENIRALAGSILGRNGAGIGGIGLRPSIQPKTIRQTTTDRGDARQMGQAGTGKYRRAGQGLTPSFHSHGDGHSADCAAWRGNLAGDPAWWLTPCAMNWHELIDQRNLELDKVIVSLLRRDPSVLTQVEHWIQERLADAHYSVHSKDALREWLEIIEERGVEGVIEVLADGGDDAVRLRQSAPFAVLMPQDERKRILRRYEALRPRTHPAGV